MTNFLILCSDEHARSALGCYGHSTVRTPMLDKLAGLGTRFTQAYTPSPICIPARASLATGLPVHEHGCWSSAEPYHGQHESWMHRLRERGNAVVSVGKLHFRSGDDDNGFAEEILPMYLANEGRGWPQGLIRQPLPNFGEARELAEQSGPGESDYTEYDRRIADEASSWLRRYPAKIKDKPWTLFVSFVSPHYPLTAPQKFFDLYDGVDVGEPFAASPAQISDHPVLSEMRKFWNYDDYFDSDTRQLARRCYYGLCSFLDHNIGAVLRALDDSGQAHDTTVLYISDHGEMLGNHGFWTKSVMFEDSVAVPMILSGPDIPASVNHTPVSLNDVAATAMQLAGHTPPAITHEAGSRALLDFVHGPELDRSILSEYHDGGSPTGSFMVRSGPWKYIYYAGGHPPQLFHLDHDAQEQNDLGEARAQEGTRDQLHGILNSMLDPEEINARAFASQAKLLETYGGAESVLAMQGFNHTPVAL